MSTMGLQPHAGWRSQLPKRSTLRAGADATCCPKAAMPTLETVERFVARVEQNAHTEAIAEFYTPDATMQENQAAPRRGRDTLVAGEAKVMARVKSLTSECVRPFFVSGDHVAIRWIFHFVWADGSSTRMEEMAWQRWEGERIAEETFFYDPAQRTPVPAA